MAVLSSSSIMMDYRTISPILAAPSTARFTDRCHHSLAPASLIRVLACMITLALFTVLTTGCNRGGNSDLEYKSAINDHFKALPACLWLQPKKFPVQAATSDDAKTEGYDALTQEGMLVRTTGEKKVLIVVSKQVNNYDLSDKGRTSWIPDTSQPGYGNFCYGNREVTSIDNSTPGTNGAGAKTVTVTYHYKIGNIASWANSQEMKTAYPSVATNLDSNPTDTATLVMTGDKWEFAK
jgi:hypothetical protein